jgi:hypothetical protein
MVLCRQSSLLVVLSAVSMCVCSRTPFENSHITPSSTAPEPTPLTPPMPWSDLVGSATSVLGARDTVRTLRTKVTLTNGGALPAYLEYGACATRVFAYRTTAPDAVPVWDSDKRRMWNVGQPLICVLYLATTTIPAGGVFSPGELTLEVPLMDMVGDSLPDGHYYFKARVGLERT